LTHDWGAVGKPGADMMAAMHEKPDGFNI